MEPTPGIVKRLLRNLYHPVALRRDSLADVIRLNRRQAPAPRPFDETDVQIVQRFVLSSVSAIDAENHTLRGALARTRQRAIVERYDIAGHPREQVAAELGISLRQFYRERRVALQRIADSIGDAVRVRAQDDVIYLERAHPRSLPGRAV